MDEKKTGIRRGEWAFNIAIVSGLVLGILIRKIKYGLFFGFILGGLFLLASWTRFTRK